MDAEIFAVVNAWYTAAPGAWDLFSDPRGAGILALAVVAVAWRIKRWLPLAAAALAVATTDPLCSYVLKPAVGRERPCAVLDAAYVPVHRDGTLQCGSGLAMPSNHAANTMAAAVASASGALVGASVLVGVSRVATGQHWPSDVLVGWGLGVATGLGARGFVRKVRGAW